MKLDDIDKRLGFESVIMHFCEGEYDNVFSQKNNKTLEETLRCKKYQRLLERVESRYSQCLSRPLGEVLLELKLKNDKFYLEFLNKWGDLKYCQFYIDDARYLNKKGLYIYSVDCVKYVGRCTDSFKRRINSGYGEIHPKNCYLDGQHTNCHINSLILKNNDKVELFIRVMNDDDEIKKEEKRLKLKYAPLWNIN